jgi:hypothetical protein
MFLVSVQLGSTYVPALFTLIMGFSKNIESGKNTITILQITIEIKIIDTQSI